MAYTNIALAHCPISILSLKPSMFHLNFNSLTGNSYGCPLIAPDASRSTHCLCAMRPLFGPWTTAHRSRSASYQQVFKKHVSLLEVHKGTSSYFSSHAWRRKQYMFLRTPIDVLDMREFCFVVSCLCS